MTDLVHAWTMGFHGALIADRVAGERLRDAALAQRLEPWTRLLTGVVVTVFSGMGFDVAAKGHALAGLPISRSEYLGQDVMAFPRVGHAWRFPVAVCELENARRDDVVAYSLWKVLCVRCALRIVVSYRETPDAARGLVGVLERDVIGAMPVAERSALTGRSIVVVGTRASSGTFPYGFFHTWRLDQNTGRFEPVLRPS